MTTELNIDDRKEARTANMRLASCGVKCLNSSAVFQINFSAGLRVLCSETRPNAKPETVSGQHNTILKQKIARQRSGEKKVYNMVVWTADMGSTRKGNFGWCRAESISTLEVGVGIVEFAEGIKKDLDNGYKIALGFECPLFVPINDQPKDLTKARDGEVFKYGDKTEVKPWSAVAGIGSLTIGLTQCVWIFEQIKKVDKIINPTFEWNKFQENSFNLFIWEAFVTGGAKSSTHSGDAEIAAKTFWDRYNNNNLNSNVTANNPYSLIGAGLLRAGLTNELSLLTQQCIVLRI